MPIPDAVKDRSFATNNDQSQDAEYDPITDNEIKEMAINQFRSYNRIMGMFLDKRRNIEKSCGYPDSGELTAERYKDLYEREPIAAKVVDLYPRACWQSPPMIFETEDIDHVTPFEARLKEIEKNLLGEGFYEGTDSPLWEYLERADRLSGIGHYGVIFIGLDDGKSLEEPADFVNKEGGVGGEPKHEILFLRVLDETLAQVASYDQDESSTRFGRPESYNLTLTDPRLSSTSSSNALSTQTHNVHWTRVVHIADTLESNEDFGAPRMRTVYNRLYDLHKLYGGSAEMFWQGAFFGISFETHPQLGGQVTIDKKAMKEQVERYQNDLQRYLALPGMSAKTLAPSVSDPTKHIDAQLEAICIFLECPKRILLGSERGELSSRQDSRNWLSKLDHRRNSYITPRIIVPFFDRLIMLGVLPIPESYGAQWEDLATVTDREKADVAHKVTEALAKYVQGDVEALIHPLDYMVRILGMEKNEAQEIFDTQMQAVAEGLLSSLAPDEEDPDDALDDEDNPFPDDGADKEDTDLE